MQAKLPKNNSLPFNDLVFHNGDVSTRVEMMAPLTEENLQRVKPSTTVIHFSSEFSDTDYLRIAEAFKVSPQAILRLWGRHRRLDFLSHFQDVKRLELDGYYDSLDPLRLISSNLEDLSLPIPPTDAFSLNSLQHLSQLRRLQLIGYDVQGPTQQDSQAGRIKTVPEFVKTFDAIAELPSLEVLSLGLLRLRDLGVLGRIPRLRSVSIGNCPIADISGIGMAKGLVHLHLYNLRNAHLLFLRNARRLQYLSLSHLSKIDAMPPFEDLTELRRVVLTSLNRLRNLSSIAQAPHLEDLVLDEEKSLKPSDLECFVGHPTLKHVWTNMGSIRKDKTVGELLGLPRLGARSPFQFIDHNGCD